jgi:hypothetical protein
MEQTKHAPRRHRREELTCYVPGCPNPRAYPPKREPILCHAHWQEFAAFRPEELSHGIGVEGYAYEAREPWLEALSYEDWRMQVFMREKEEELWHTPALGPAVSSPSEE